MAFSISDVALASVTFEAIYPIDLRFTLPPFLILSAVVKSCCSSSLLILTWGKNLPTSFLLTSLACSLMIFCLLIPDRGIAIYFEESFFKFFNCFFNLVVFITSGFCWSLVSEPTALFLSREERISAKSNWVLLGLIFVTSLPSALLTFLTLAGRWISASDLFLDRAVVSSAPLSMMLLALLLACFCSFVVSIFYRPKNFYLSRSIVAGSHFAGSMPIWFFITSNNCASPSLLDILECYFLNYYKWYNYGLIEYK